MIIVIEKLRSWKGNLGIGMAINLVDFGVHCGEAVGVSGDGPRFTGYDADWLSRKYKIEKGNDAWKRYDFKGFMEERKVYGVDWIVV